MVRRGLWHFVQRQMRLAGVNIGKFPASGTLPYLLRFCGIDTVLDVGANVGQTGQMLRDLHYRGRIISFEPLSEAFKVLELK